MKSFGKMLLEQEKAQLRLLCLCLYAHGLEACITCKTFCHFERKNEEKNLFLDVEILHYDALHSE